MIFKKCAFLLFFLAILLFPDFLRAQADDENLQGDLKNLCTALRISTSRLANDPAYQQDVAERDSAETDQMRVWAELLADMELRTNISVDELDSSELAAFMAEYEPQVETADSDSGDETWSSFDIARTSLAVASIADPVGVVGVAAAYTYAKCGTTEAETGVGDFCWKNSYGRTAGVLPKGFGRVADCPEDYTNTGLTCFRPASTYAQASRVADCPKGYTNMGLTCFRPASTYGQASRVADCPKGYTNMGASCYKFPFSSLGMSSMTCRSGEFRTGGRCYKECKPGYTNNGEFCGRGASSRGVGSMTCRSGEFRTGGRCYKECKPGYTNNGEFCGRGASSLGLASMTCNSGEFFNLGRCYPSDTCPAGYEMDGIGLCYPTCRSGFSGVGPVCWSACEGRFGAACAAGCATSAAECALATTDMVASPLEVVGSIATLGGYGPAKASRKAAQLAKTGVKQGTKAFTQSVVGRKLGSALSAVAKAGSDTALRKGADDIARAIADNARAGAKNIRKAATAMRTNYVKLRKLMAEKLFVPIADRAKLLAKTGWEKTRNGWRQVKTRVTGKEDIVPIDEWWKLDEIDPKSLRAKASQLHDRLKAVRKTIESDDALRWEKLARSCTKFGIVIADKV
ncbi:MAG: hypothetical protein KDG54_05360 [Geminicoccaceae bacterium]|nr:hypothetical protein [Geminicoccaceae bacterium]